MLNKITVLKKTKMTINARASTINRILHKQLPIKELKYKKLLRQVLGEYLRIKSVNVKI